MRYFLPQSGHFGVMITTPVRPLIAGEKVGERKGKEGEEPEETDDRGEKDAEEEHHEFEKL